MRKILALGLVLAAACTTVEQSAVDGAAIPAGRAADSTDVAAPTGAGGVALAPAVVFPDTPFGREARRGLAILNATRDSLPGHVGNQLRCTSCHLDDGRRQFSMTWVGVNARYPQYRSRAAAVLTVEDRVQECIERSLAGRRLPEDDERIGAILAYYALLSYGIPGGARVRGQGVDSARGESADPKRGATVYLAQCARCHGVNGEGTALATPLWGDGAYTIAAGMARVRMAAAFIKRNMPHDMPGTLTDQQALDVAAYINAQPRKDYAGKERDWPKGGAPADVPFKTLAGSAPR
jgi:thiosulfate dehydrogenase